MFMINEGQMNMVKLIEQEPEAVARMLNHSLCKWIKQYGVPETIVFEDHNVIDYLGDILETLHISLDDRLEHTEMFYDLYVQVFDKLNPLTKKEAAVIDAIMNNHLSNLFSMNVNDDMLECISFRMSIDEDIKNKVMKKLKSVKM